MKLRDANGRMYSPTDIHSNGLVTIDTLHNLIHLGRVFFVSVAPTVASSATYSVGLLTGDDEIHMQLITVGVSGAQKSEAKAELLEAASITGGTAGTIYNQNRKSSHTTDMTYKYGVTVSDAGTVLDPGEFGGTSGASGERTQCMPLKANTQYVVRATNMSNAEATVSIYVLFYNELESAE